MIRIGLTGGIGSGKSTISNMIKNKGINVIDADIIAREVLMKYPKIIELVIERFGHEFVDKAGNLKRREFGNYIFQHEDKRKEYEDIIIPFIISEIEYKINALERKGENICVLDAPTLIEHGLHKTMNFNILVWVDKETQLERVMKRDDITKEKAVDRINAQMDLNQKKKEVDFIIDNTGELKESKYQVDNIFLVISKDMTGGE